MIHTLVRIREKKKTTFEPFLVSSGARITLALNNTFLLPQLLSKLRTAELLGGAS
jgi:hypothetical protein